MNGRWTLYPCPECSERVEYIGAIGGPGRTWACKNGHHFNTADADWATPVVPVDDAAVERATVAAREHSHAEVGWHPDTDTFAVYFIEGPGPEWKVFKIVEGYATIELASADVGRLRAVAILRAAGEVASDGPV